METEFTSYSFTDGVRTRYMYRNRYSFGAGLERSQINQRFQYTDPDARDVRTLITFDTLFMPDGSFTTSSDTMRMDIQGELTNDVANRITGINIPIFAAYHYSKGRWRFGLQGGVVFNALLSNKGRILDSFGDPKWISSNSANELKVYKSKIGITFDASITVGFKLTEYISLIIEPHFRYNPNSYTVENYELEQYFQTVGLRTGFTYSLN